MFEDRFTRQIRQKYNAGSKVAEMQSLQRTALSRATWYLRLCSERSSSYVHWARDVSKLSRRRSSVPVYVSGQNETLVTTRYLRLQVYVSYNEKLVAWRVTLWQLQLVSIRIAALRIYSFSGAFEKPRKAAFSFVMPVYPHGTTRLPLNGFSWYLLFGYFSDICRENSSCIKIWQE